jgi:hypothetical protein
MMTSGPAGTRLAGCSTASREQVDGATVACILSLGRFCAQGTELALSKHWCANTALDDLLGVCSAEVYDNRLYRGMDERLPLR